MADSISARASKTVAKAPAARRKKPDAVVSAAPVSTPQAKTSGPGAKASAGKKAAAAKPKASSPRAIKHAGISTEDIALRAYFICENRHRLGLPGSESQDWLQAEAELMAERAKKKKSTSARKKTAAA